MDVLSIITPICKHDQLVSTAILNKSTQLHAWLTWACTSSSARLGHGDSKEDSNFAQEWSLLRHLRTLKQFGKAPSEGRAKNCCSFCKESCRKPWLWNMSKKCTIYPHDYFCRKSMSLAWSSLHFWKRFVANLLGCSPVRLQSIIPFLAICQDAGNAVTHHLCQILWHLVIFG